MEWTKDDIKQALVSLSELRRMKEIELTMTLARDVRSTEVRAAFFDRCQELEAPFEDLHERVRNALLNLTEGKMKGLTEAEQAARNEHHKAEQAVLEEQKQKLKAHLQTDRLLAKVWHVVETGVKYA